MPTYQYVCTECSEPLEVVQKFSDAALTDCPACSGRLRKVFSAAAIVFKGSGFYRTDSRDSGKKPAASGSSNGSAKKDEPKKSAATSESNGSSGSSSSSASSSSSSSSASSGSAKEKVAS